MKGGILRYFVERRRIAPAGYGWEIVRRFAKKQAALDCFAALPEIPAARVVDNFTGSVIAPQPVGESGPVPNMKPLRDLLNLRRKL